MSVEEDKKLKEQKSRTKRQRRRSTERKERNSFADSSMPVDSSPIQKASYSEDNIHDSKMPAVQEQNTVIVPAASTIQQKRYIQVVCHLVIAKFPISEEGRYILRQ